MSTKSEDEVVIVGAGLVGTVLAMYLAQQNHRVVVYEGRSDPRNGPPPSGRSINLTLADRGWKALRELGIAGEIRKRSLPLLGRMIHDESGNLHHQPYTEKGDALYAISRFSLNLELLEQASQSPNIELVFDHRCIEVDVERRTLLFERTDKGGAPVEVSSQVAFAADGAYSGARRSLLRAPGFQFFQKYSFLQYKELSIAAPPMGGWPLDESLLHVWPRGDHLLVAFPNLGGSMTCSIFLPTHGDPSFESINTPSDLRAFFERTCKDLLPLMPNLEYDYFARAPSSLVTTRCAPWVHGGWLALIGDAAHAMVPFLGQGANAGLEDCSVLAAALRRGGGWAAVLAEFERRRRDNCDTLTGLAERHYMELAERARDPNFVVEKALEQKIYRMAPDRFIPLYNMISFRDTSYVEVDRRARRQQGLIAELMKIPGIEEIWNTPEVEREIRRLLADFQPVVNRSLAGAPLVELAEP
jgi:kynurenine 3-monooxygenase